MYNKNEHSKFNIGKEEVGNIPRGITKRKRTHLRLPCMGL
jgi:hypothetical protein